MELGIRFLVVFNARTVKTSNFVTIKDLHADRADGSSADGTGSDMMTSGASGSGGGKSKTGTATGEANSVFQINMKDIRAFIRGRFKQYVRPLIYIRVSMD
jgi:hypothetical protein